MILVSIPFRLEELVSMHAVLAYSSTLKMDAVSSYETSVN
jgi:hypothetical protein